MAEPEAIRTAFQRNIRAISRRPSVGRTTGTTRVRVRDGTTCEIKGSGWTLTADVGTAQGGNNAGPGPGVLERAALGSCLAIGYATWAAHLGVPIYDIEVQVETDFDARGSLALEDRQPGFDAIRYHVRVESPAPRADVLRVLDHADSHSPVRDDFARAIPITRETESVSERSAAQ